MIYHILNGDALLNEFSRTGLPGEVIVCRECLIEGPLEGESPDEFFNNRSKFIHREYADDPGGLNYNDYVKAEFEKILNIPAGSDVILWFEHDLFCQANMWFIISLLSPGASEINISRAMPIYTGNDELWAGFGKSSAQDLINSFDNRILLNVNDIKLTEKLWKAYKYNEPGQLTELSLSASEKFPYLKEVINAQIERFPPADRPARTIKHIINTGKTDFSSVFSEFYKTEGIYGFGDVQVKRIYDEIIKKESH